MMMTTTTMMMTTMDEGRFHGDAVMDENPAFRGGKVYESGTSDTRPHAPTEAREEIKVWNE